MTLPLLWPLDASSLALRAYRALARTRDPGFDFAPVSQADRRPAMPLRAPLPRASIALVSTAGLFVRSSQPAFDVSQPGGDPSFRELPVDLPAEALALTPGRFDPSAV